jgi:hypothetical protein
MQPVILGEDQRLPRRDHNRSATTPMLEIDALLCAALRGATPTWLAVGDMDFAARFLERSAYQGVQSLLHQLLDAKQAIAKGWPPEVLAECRRQAIGRTMWELRHQALLSQVLEELASIDAQPVLFKGTALAYGLYPNPVLRTRGDTDLLIPLHARGRATEVLAHMGFQRDPGVRGDCMSHQESLTYAEPGGSHHCLDLHWQVNNEGLLVELFTYEELRARAQPLPELGPRAIAPDPLHALLLACMHRSRHKQAPYYVDGVAHYSGDRLIWLYDIHLLAQRLTGDDWHELIEMATRKGLRALCREGLHLARMCSSTEVPPEVMEALARPGNPEPIAAYMERSAIRRLWMDFCVIGGWRYKLGFLSEKLFPPAGYMRQQYPDAKLTWLPWLYLRRATGWIFEILKGRGE